MKKIAFSLLVLMLMFIGGNSKKLNAEEQLPPCPMGYAIFEHNIFGGGHFLVLRCDCMYEHCKAWDQQCQAGVIQI